MARTKGTIHWALLALLVSFTISMLEDNLSGRYQSIEKFRAILKNISSAVQSIGVMNNTMPTSIAFLDGSSCKPGYICV